MTNFTERTAHHFLTIKVAKGLIKEIEQAGLENLKVLAQNNISIVGTYLNGCSAQRKAEIRRDFGMLLRLGVTADMIFDELIKRMPVLAPIMAGKEGYKKLELEGLKKFLKEG